ncbi:MAG: GNAT family N-acetyltransferase [Bacteroidota bacterium]
MEIRKASISDTKVLTKLALNSKNHWGYGGAKIEEWRNELTITEAYIERNHVLKLVDRNCIKAFYSYCIKKDNAILLDFFFVNVNYIGKGLGRLMMENFLSRIENKGYAKIEVESDVNAITFYKQFGFEALTVMDKEPQNLLELKL